MKRKHTHKHTLYTPIKTGCLFRKLLKRIPFHYISNVVYKFPALMVAHILGTLATVYLTESWSIKIRLPSHLDFHIWLNTVKILGITSIGLMWRLFKETI